MLLDPQFDGRMILSAIWVNHCCLQFEVLHYPNPNPHYLTLDFQDENFS
jgi:hypothetical protein